MSEVWGADDLTLERQVALKLLSPTADLERFRREARAVAALSHENVMQVYDYGEDEAAGPFMALEWLRGGTLEERLARGRLPPAEAQSVAEGVAAGLAHLHGRGLVHRDLKPANVLFDDEGRPKLGDFGLARHAAGAGTLTEAGTVLGTAAYISPEQAGGEPAGPASDVYSFGVILFRMLTGALPFVADDAIALLHMHRHEPPPAVETLQPDVPPALAALTAAALQKEPANRPADGNALLAALGAAPLAAAVLPEAEATQVLPAAAPLAVESRPRRRTATGAVAALVLLGLAGAGLAWLVTRPPATPAGITTGTSAGTTAARSGHSTHAATTTPAHTVRHPKRKHRPSTTTAQGTTSRTTTTHTTTAQTTTPPTTTQGTTVTTTTTTSTSTATTTTTATTGAGTTTGVTGTPAPVRGRRTSRPRA
jgi:serine/threonine-protein kinase